MAEHELYEEEIRRHTHTHTRTHTQTEGHVKALEEDGHLEAKERGLRRNQLC